MRLVTKLIQNINAALLEGDMAAVHANLDELTDVSPDDARDVLMILSPLGVG